LQQRHDLTIVSINQEGVVTVNVYPHIESERIGTVASGEDLRPSRDYLDGTAKAASRSQELELAEVVS
jgi:hypothetical protein